MDAFRRFLLHPIPILKDHIKSTNNNTKRKFIHLPVFQTNEVKILNKPNDFYKEIRKQIQSTTKKVSLASLYVGTGEKEVTLINDLCKLIKTKNNIYIISFNSLQAWYLSSNTRY